MGKLPAGAKGTTNTVSSAAAAPRAAANTAAPKVFDMARAVNPGSGLGEEGRRYCDRIMSYFIDNKRAVTSLPLNARKIEGRAFIDEATNRAVILAFVETNNNLDGMPPAARAGDLADVLAMVRGSAKDTRVIETIVIDTVDYACVDKMATALFNLFLVDEIATGFSVESWDGARVKFITAPDKVRNYIRSISPHAVPARDDIGVLVCLEERQDPNAFSLTGHREKEYRELFAITGYTRIFAPEQGGALNYGGTTTPKFMPIATITDIVTPIPDLKMLGAALPFAVEVFINKSLWSRPYQNFNKEQPNLGSLITDSKSKAPYFLSSIGDLLNFSRTYLTQPFLAVDITEGRYRIRGLDALASNIGAVLDQLIDFVGPTNWEAEQNAARERITEKNAALLNFTNITGTVSVNGAPVDSRCVDYLSLATKCNDISKIAHFLVQPMQLQARIEQVRELFPETKSLYITDTVVLPSTLVEILGRAFSKHIVVDPEGQAQDGSLNLTGLLNSTGNIYGNLSFGSPAYSNAGYQRPNLYSW